MFFKSNEQKQRILEVDDDFANLEKIITSEATSNMISRSSGDNPGELRFNFSYKISQLKAIEENATSVRITVKKPSKARHTIIKSNKAGGNDNNEIIDRILTHKTKIDLSNKSEEILYVTYSDITSKINNRLLDAIRTGQSDIDSLGLRKQKLVVRTVEEVIQNNLQENLISPKIAKRDLDANKNIFSTFKLRSQDERELYYNLMSTGVSPATSISQANSRFISTHKLSQGLLTSNKKEDRSNSSFYSDILLNFLLFEDRQQNTTINEKNAKELVTTLERVIDNSIILNSKINLKASVLNSDSPIVVQFELLQNKKNESGENIVSTIDKVEKLFNPNEYVKDYFLPLKPALVKSSKVKDKICFSVSQMDERANGIKVYKKTINNNIYSDFELIDEFSLSKVSGPLTVSYINEEKEFAIFRFVSISTNNIDFLPCEFSEVVVHQKKNYRHLVLIPQLVEGGIRIHAYNNDPTIKSARLLVKNVTSKQKKFVETGKTFHFSKTETRKSEFLSGFEKNKIYEFSTKVELASGIEMMSSHLARIEFLPYESNALKVSFTEATDSNLLNDVQLTINATLQIDQIGQIDQLRPSMSKNYSGDESREAAYDKYVFFNIVRYDTVSGEEQDLGIIVNGETFVDSTQSSKANALPIIADRSYKYIITPLVRDPNSFQESVEKKDELSNKMYKMSPKKHHHPLALQRGMITSIEGINNDPTHAAIYGKLGLAYTIDLDRKIQNPVITNFKATKNKKHIFLSWKIEGVISMIDHFVILKECDKIRDVLGKSHAITKDLIYKHEINHDDVGNNRYMLVPIYSDYSMGTMTYSNYVLIDESDVKK